MPVTQHQADCIFCRIVNGDMPAAVVMRSDRVLAILDAFPSSRGHCLVLPTEHHENLMAMPTDLLTACAETTQLIARAAQATLQPDGIALTQFNGAAAGQTIFHYHQHVIPRWRGQDWRSHGKEKADPEELLMLAERIRRNLEREERE